MKLLVILFFALLGTFGLMTGTSHPSEPTLVCPNVATHYSYFSTKPFFDTAYKDVPEQPGDPTVKGIIVNHHLLPSDLIAKTMQRIATDKPVTVLLISPNHFSAGKAQIISSLGDWQTPYGMLPPDCTLISSLQQQGVLSVEESPFVKEHGVSGIVAFIKKSLPNARIVPIILKDTTSEKDLNAFIDAVSMSINDTTLVVGSFDFSHDLPDAAAQFHDQKSLAVIQSFDLKGEKVLDIDSVPGLAVVLQLMEKVDAMRFTVTAQTNSAQALHDPSIEATTSYIDGVFTHGEKIVNMTITVLGFGDLMLDRGVKQQIIRRGKDYPFLPLERFLKGSDVVAANAEGVFVESASHADLQFAFDPKIVPTLRKFGFTLFSQANNHSSNFGPVALQQSKEILEKNSIDVLGDPLNKNPGPIIKTVRGQKIAYVSYNQFTGGGITSAVKAISNAKTEGAFVIVYPHWGVEYDQSFTQSQQDTAHAFIDAGADLILGSHPHVIQPLEIYKGKAIFYSLGNFIFDQAANGPTGQGLAVGAAIDGGKVTYYLFPFAIRAGQASLLPYKNRVTLLEHIVGQALVPETLRGDLKNGIFILQASHE